MSALLALLAAGALVPSTPNLGIAAGRCRAEESGWSFLVEVAGLKDRRGQLKLELYPADEADFLADDNVLVSAGKPFARVVEAVPAAGPVTLCIRAPGPGRYGLSLLHDRDSNRKFSLATDGIGFSNNPKLGWSKPKAAAVAITIEHTPVRVRIVMNYRTGLMSFGPLRS